MNLEKIIKINDINNKESLKKVLSFLRQGKIIVFPAQSIYGITCDAFNLDSVNNIFKIKKRSFEKALPLLIRDEFELIKYVKEVPNEAKILIEKFWAGRISLVFNAKNNIPRILKSKEDKICFRQPANLFMNSLLKKFENPIVATSANISGKSSVSSISEISSEILDSVDLIIDAGSLKGNLPSTVIDITKKPLKILREGIIKKEEIKTIFPNSN